MDELRSEHARREAEGWAAFEDALSRVPDDRLTAPGVLEGWTVKEMLHHVTGWIEQLIVRFDHLGDPAYVDPFETDELVDARNAALADEARSMDVASVRDRLERARSSLLQVWHDLPEIDETVAGSFAGETYEHYEEHLPDLWTASGA